MRSVRGRSPDAGMGMSPYTEFLSGLVYYCGNLSLTGVRP